MQSTLQKTCKYFCEFASMQIGMEQCKTGSEKISLNCLDVTFSNHLQKFMAEKKIKVKRIEVSSPLLLLGIIPFAEIYFQSESADGVKFLGFLHH